MFGPGAGGARVIVLLALCAALGFLTGARTFAPVAMVAFAATYGWLDVSGTGLAWLGNVAPTAILILLAMGELYGDKLPDAPNRTVWYALTGRIVIGALAGLVVALHVSRGAMAMGANMWWETVAGAIAGGVGAAIGTFVTFRARAGLIARHGAIPAALIEDAFVILGTAAIILALA